METITAKTSIPLGVVCISAIALLSGIAWLFSMREDLAVLKYRMTGVEETVHKMDGKLDEAIRAGRKGTP